MSATTDAITIEQMEAARLADIELEMEFDRPIKVDLSYELSLKHTDLRFEAVDGTTIAGVPIPSKWYNLNGMSRHWHETMDPYPLPESRDKSVLLCFPVVVGGIPRWMEVVLCNPWGILFNDFLRGLLLPSLELLAPDMDGVKWILRNFLRDSPLIAKWRIPDRYRALLDVLHTHGLKLEDLDASLDDLFFTHPALIQILEAQMLEGRIVEDWKRYNMKGPFFITHVRYLPWVGVDVPAGEIAAFNTRRLWPFLRKMMRHRSIALFWHDQTKRQM